jgi:hypothetical protein
MTGFSWFQGARQLTGMRDYFENPCAEGTLECGSASFRLSLGFHGGFAVELQGA